MEGGKDVLEPKVELEPSLPKYYSSKSKFQNKNLSLGQNFLKIPTENTEEETKKLKEYKFKTYDPSHEKAFSTRNFFFDLL